jgi:hypothetical protein
MPSSLKNPFKRKAPLDKDKVVLKKADKHTTEISIQRVEKTSQVSPAPPPPVQFDENAFMDVPTLKALLKQRNEQIASLKNQVADLTSRLNEVEVQQQLCSCGAKEKQPSGPRLKSNFSKW